MVIIETVLGNINDREWAEAIVCVRDRYSGTRPVGGAEKSLPEKDCQGRRTRRRA